MKIIRDLVRFVALLISISLVVGVFFFIYSTLSPQGEDDGGGILVKNTPFPTAVSLEDVPLGLYLQQHQAELAAPAGSDGTAMAFTVAAGELPADVAEHLKQQGLVSSAELFVQWVKYRHIGNKIQAGEYVLRRTMTMDEIAEALQHGRAKTVTVTIRPGWRAEEVAEFVGTLGLVNVTKDQFLKAAQSPKYDYAFLRDRPKNAPNTLEGYLFPESYNVPYDITLDALMAVILGTFDQRVTAQMRQQAATAKLTLGEVVALAAIVEREAAVASERATIASVYLNRLKKKQYLQADPTVQYAMGYQAASKQWWKSPVSLDEYQNVKSPYNTYLQAGLTPGPICSPSLASIIAVLEPAQTEYYFFLGKGDGSHVFAKTFEEHQQNMQKYGYTK